MHPMDEMNLGKNLPGKNHPGKYHPGEKISSPAEKISPKVGKNPPSGEHLHISVYRLVVYTSVIFDRWNGAIVKTLRTS